MRAPPGMPERRQLGEPAAPSRTMNGENTEDGPLFDPCPLVCACCGHRPWRSSELRMETGQQGESARFGHAFHHVDIVPENLGFGARDCAVATAQRTKDGKHPGWVKSP